MEKLILLEAKIEIVYISSHRVCLSYFNIIKLLIEDHKYVGKCCQK